MQPTPQQQQPPQRITDYFPMPPARTPDTTIYIFGCQVLAYILASDADLYGLLSDQDLEDARYAAKYALIAREISPIAVEKITQIQLTIHLILTRRAAEREMQAFAAALSADEPRPSLEGGAKVPTHPRPPAPPQPDALTLPRMPQVPPAAKKPVADFQF